MDSDFSKFRALAWHLLPAVYYAMDIHTHEILDANRFAKDLFGEIKHRRCWEVLQKDQNGPCAFCRNGDLVDAHGTPTGPCRWRVRNSITLKWYDVTDVAFFLGNGRLVKFELAVEVPPAAGMSGQEAESDRGTTQAAGTDGITVMCQHCHRIRDASRRWQSPAPLLEAFLQTSVSFGICPDCGKTFYPDYDLDF